SKVTYDCPDLGEMFCGRAADGAALLRLKQNVDKRTTFKRFFAEPAVEGIEDGQQAFFRDGRASVDFRFEPAPRPHLLARIQKGDRQFVLRAEVAVKARFSAVRSIEDGINTDLADAAFGEQLIGSLKNALARAGRHSRRSFAQDSILIC